MAGYEKDLAAPQAGAKAEFRARGNAPINTPIECEKCGSNWFYSVHAEQFSGGGYGSVEMRSITGNPVQMRICLCGNPIVPQAQNFGGSRALGTRESFYMSAKAAKAARTEMTPDKVAEIAASPIEIKDLQKQIDDMKELLKQLQELKDSLPKKKNKGTEGTGPK